MPEIPGGMPEIPGECRLCTSKSDSVGINAVPKTVVLAGRV